MAVYAYQAAPPVARNEPLSFDWRNLDVKTRDGKEQKAQRVFERYLFEKGKVLYEQENLKKQGDWKSDLVELNQKYGSPIYTVWALVRNVLGVSIAILNILAFFGVIV